VYRLVHDTPPDELYSVGRVSNGEYGVDPGLIFSFPSRTDNGVSHIVEGLAINDHARTMIQATMDELRKEREMCVELGLIPGEPALAS
jgi:malate dehydrogenase